MSTRSRSVAALGLGTALALTSAAVAQTQMSQPDQASAPGSQQGALAEAERALARGDIQGYHRGLLRAPQTLPPALRQILETGQELRVQAQAQAVAETVPRAAGQRQQHGPQQMDQQAQRRIPSQYREERGRIVEVRPARVRGVSTPNYLAVIETQPGRRVVADIGQAIQGANIQPGAPIAIRGKIVRIGNRGALLMANAIRIGNQVYDVNRPAYMRSR